MPELGEVEIVRRNLHEWWVGESASDVQLHDDGLLKRGSADALRSSLKSEARRACRRGKYLWVEFADDTSVMFHFRMTGKITLEQEPDPDYARLAWQVSSGWLVFKDPRRLGQVLVFDAGELEDYEPLVEMGPEPYDLDADELRDILPERRMLKSALLDQKVIAGVGNIAVSELLWRLKLAPKVKVRDLADGDFKDLADELPTFFDDVIDAQMADEVVYMTSGKDVENPFDVYGREGEPCPRCDTQIERAKVSGRSSYFCPSCQC